MSVEETKMSRKILCYFIAITVSIVLAGQSYAQVTQQGQASLAIRVDGAPEISVILGQEEPAKKPGLFERMKRSIANWARDDEYEDGVEHSTQHSVQQDASRPTKPVSIPTRPPKPVTATEVRQAAEDPGQPAPDRRTTTTNRTAQEPQRRPATSHVLVKQETVAVNEAAPPVEEDAAAASTDQEDTIFDRLKQIREQVFEKQPIDENAFAQEISGSKNAPMPSHYGSTQRVQQTPVRRSPPPRVEIEEPAMSNRRGVHQVDTDEEEDYYVERENANNRPMPIRSRSSDDDRQARDNPPLLASNRSESTPYTNSRTSRSPVASRETNEYVTGRERTAPLSGVEVHREPARTPSRRERTETARPTASVETTSTPTSKVNGEYQIAARRMLSTERSGREAPNVESGNNSFAATETTDAIRMSDSASQEKTVLVSPRLEVETESDPRAIVGQEANYKIRVQNRGGAPAEQVVLSVEIPDWIEIRQPDVSAGTTSIVPRSGSKEIRDFNWKISRIEANGDALLVLRLVPQQRKSIDLKIRYDFFKPAAVTKMVVQEPVIEMELDGPAEVLWGTQVGYRLLVRNTGNGDAENVELELLQTGSDMKSCELPLLKAGEEQVVVVDVWTGKQENIDINIQATGKYDLSAKVSKRVKVMRPNVIMTIDAPTIQFVGNSAEFVIKVRNVGNASAKDLELATTLPLGARFESCSVGGEATPENQVIWKIDSIPVGDVFEARLACQPQREGTCNLEASVNDKSGTLANCSSAFEAAAIVELKLDVENPQGPIEVGREAVYTVNLGNRGTKAAENVEVTVFFGKHLDPYAIEGGTAYTSDGQVVFDKIPTIGPEQQLTLKVKARADEAGSHRIRTEVVCKTSEIHLVNEQATFFYRKEKGKISASSRESDREDGSLRSTPLKTASVPTPINASSTPPVAKEKPASSPPALPSIITAEPSAPSAETVKSPVDPFLAQ